MVAPVVISTADDWPGAPVERSDDGWRVGVEVVESHRIPESCDILAIYEVGLEAGGDLASYRRTERYARGQTLGRSR